jgi:hypothetical protein
MYFQDLIFIDVIKIILFYFITVQSEAQDKNLSDNNNRKYNNNNNNIYIYYVIMMGGDLSINDTKFFNFLLDFFLN